MRAHALLDTPRGDELNYSAMPSSNTATRSRPALWWGLAAGALAIGYADLIRGGVTLSAVFLVLGYCVLIPLAILK